MVTQNATGVGIYTINLLKQLLPLLAQSNITHTIYTYEIAYFSDHAGVRKISLGKLLDFIFLRRLSLHRHLWNIFYLGVIARSFNLVYSFSTHGTLCHRNQVITIHDLICFAYPDQHKSQYYYFKYFVDRLINNSRHTVTISNFTKNEVLNRYKKASKAQVSVISNGVDHFTDSFVHQDEVEWVKNLTDRSPFCTIIGASYKHKNVETLLHVALRLEQTGIKIVVVNKENSYFKHLKNLAKQLNVQNVIFLSYLSEEKLAALYSEAKLNLYISLYEGFGFPPAEALFFGTPSLLSKQPALIEIYGTVFPFVNADNVGSITGKIVQMCSEKEMFLHTFNDLAKKYSWKTSAEKSFILIKRLLN
jgi:glycosyltransferase involved in cell wall biosynthesis